MVEVFMDILKSLECRVATWIRVLKIDVHPLGQIGIESHIQGFMDVFGKSFE